MDSSRCSRVLMSLIALAACGCHASYLLGRNGGGGSTGAGGAGAATLADGGMGGEGAGTGGAGVGGASGAPGTGGAPGAGGGGASGAPGTGGTDGGPDAALPDAGDASSGSGGSTASGPRGNAGRTPADLPEASPLIGCAAKLPYSGPLCAGSDCVVLGRSVLAPGLGSGTSSPSGLAMADDCRPHVIYASFLPATVAQYFGRMNGGWTTENITSPTSIASPSAIVVDPSSQVPTVIVKHLDPSGLSDTWELWQRQAAGWTNLGAADGTYYIWGAFARGPDGTLHVLRQPMADVSTIEHGISATGTAWTFQTVPSPPYSQAQIALTPDGAPQFTFNEAPTEHSTGLTWAALGQAAEEITPVDPNVYEVLTSRFVVTGTPGDPHAGVPHVIYDANVGYDGSAGQPAVSSLWYASRDGGTWHATPIVTSAAGGTCFSYVTEAGLVCNYDYEVFMALAIVGTTDGQVRLLYLRRHYAGTITSICMRGPGVTMCYFPRPDAPVEAQLWIAWPEPDGSVAAAPLLDEFDVAGTPSSAFSQQKVAIDSLGRIHLLADMSDGSLAYFLIGPSSH